MPVPQSAQALSLQTPNSSQPIAMVEGSVELQDERGGLVRGSISLPAIATLAWRYFLATFAQTSTGIDPGFSQTISNPPTQAEVQALSDQVALLSAQLGRIS